MAAAFGCLLLASVVAQDPILSVLPVRFIGINAPIDGFRAFPLLINVHRTCFRGFSVLHGDGVASRQRSSGCFIAIPILQTQSVLILRNGATIPRDFGSYSEVRNSFAL